MEFKSDEEINDLLNLSSSVISELQRAELKPPQTLGKPQVPSGNTTSLISLWEAEGAPENKLGRGNTGTATDTEGEQDQQIVQTEIEQTHTEDTCPKEIPVDNPGSFTQESDLDKTLKKLEQRNSNLLKKTDSPDAGTTFKKGGQIAPKHQPLPSQVIEGNLPPQDCRQSRPSRTDASQRPSTTPKGAHPQLHPFQDIEENTQSVPLDHPLKLLVGATPDVHQFEQSQGENGAHVGNVLESASFAEMTLSVLNEVLIRVARMEEKINDILKTNSTIPLIRNDISQLKATTALLSTQMASVQVLDPGNAGFKSLSEMKAASKPAIIAISGPGDMDAVPIQDKLLVKDVLGRPISAERNIQAKETPDSVITQSDKDAIQSLIDTLVEDTSKQARLKAQLERVQDKPGLLKLKRLIYNA
ncbi:phosphoprotein [avian paramyxovirus 15]|uniref:Phosphoprotein n=1 Tax=avian paramyxovirus 15 TaxID=1983777 RepID=A0A1W6R4X4_9MONO|nr:phosphoprotein [Avian paramyxovirus 15]ARO49354.1 phosphoprotein [Avian paramyxovirus 15]